MQKSFRTHTAVFACALTLAAATVAACSPGEDPHDRHPDVPSTAAAAAQSPAPGDKAPAVSPAGETTAQSRKAVPLTVGLTYIPNVQFSPMYVATQAGYVGGEVTLRHHGQSEGLFTALLAGREQVVVAGADEAAAAKSDELVVIAPYYEKYPVAVIATQASGIATMADLKGKTVGIPGHYGEGWYGLLAGLRSAGMTVDDITLQEIGYTQQAALSTGKVDAVVGFINNDAVQFKLNDLPVTVITPEVKALRSASLVTTKAFAADHPEQLTQLVSGVFRAYRDLADDPSAGVAATAKLVPELSDKTQRRAAEATMDATVGLFPASLDSCRELTADNAEAMVAELKAIGLSPQIDGSELFTDEFCG
ncbi:ABC transporter substrate-binding protein [Corynebacterium mendelii]|uniref:ABC transporter substrate-binding protein n=1 Tax=Corynebacterium mendelii TaxID=2765362 RepID=A0A939DZJ8_9CORY|nr:ABC transporter substrate-binding protein [Corynebacterium mendelii]MBN9643933.1 ABC transporter substrate-binding protein [Corynebacterium mendelii]